MMWRMRTNGIFDLGFSIWDFRFPIQPTASPAARRSDLEPATKIRKLETRDPFPGITPGPNELQNFRTLEPQNFGTPKPA